MTATPEGAITETLCENDWVSLMVVRKPEAGVNGYVYSHETRCRGRIVAVLPYQDTAAGREYLVKSEVTPCWGFDQVLSAITGGWEDGDIEDDAVREMLEETGYAITRGELIPLGESFASKSADTVYSLFSVNLTGRVAGEAIGDGTRLESESAAVWVDAAMLATLHDPQLAVMCMRLAATYEPAGSPQGPEGGPGTGMALIAAERARQVAAEGYTPEHDAGHPHGDLAEAAAAYALAATADPAAREFWPWDLASFKPGDAIRSLIKAGALIAAEIDRLTAMGDDHG